MEQYILFYRRKYFQREKAKRMFKACQLEGQISENWPENRVFLLHCSYIGILELRRDAIL